MVETTKQVRVDNWGIYFLHRLQLFFSKTDYCDLTLQFEGNVQLKVHRLVMNACTEYFSFLEQTCPAPEENTIMMPTDLQADVIVPIVNFMYTGMLEFHPSIFEKLYRAAETMNIAVLSKLLEAQVSQFRNKTKKVPPTPLGGAKRSTKPQVVETIANDTPTTVPPKKTPTVKKRSLGSSAAAHPVSATFSNKWNSDPPERDPLFIADNTPKPTRFEWPDDDQPPFSMDPSFDDISLTSKPLWTKEDEQKAASSFEEVHSVAQKSHQLSSRNISVLQDSEEEDPKGNVPQLEEPSNISGDNHLKRKGDSKVFSSPKRVKIINQDDETIISIKTNNPNELDHTKIVSEILKKYPDLVKKKKNIKLKITSTKNDSSPVKEQNVKEKVKPHAISPVEKAATPTPSQKDMKVETYMGVQKGPSYNSPSIRKGRSKADFRAASDEGPWTCLECLGDGEAPEFVLYYLFRKHMTDAHQMEFDNSFCKYCGRKCSTDKTMAYHLYTKHGLRPPSNITFPKCTMCPYIGISSENVQEHMKTHGKDEVQCVKCKLGFLTNKDLSYHQQITGHHNHPPNKKSVTIPSLMVLDCPYCVKKLQSSISLFTHIRSQHMKEGKRDGITSLDEVMDIPYETKNEVSEDSKISKSDEKNYDTVNNRVDDSSHSYIKDKLNIISNVKVGTRLEGSNSSNEKKTIERQVIREQESVTVATTTSAIGSIGGSLATNLGLVDIVVLDDNQQYILQQPQGQAGAAEFILPELATNEGILQAATNAAELNSTDELVMVLTDHDYQDEQNQGQSDNSNIVVLYSHPVEGQQGQFITSQGNILVNSQGMLEIRNGAGITTTAGQIIVNNNSTTTTQAIESPIESIELIRKEIEGSIGEQEGERNDDIKSVLRKKDKEISKIQEVILNKISNQSTSNNIECNVETAIKPNNDIIDSTDSAIQEEPMEVEEIDTQPRECEEQVFDSQPENQSVENLIENQKLVTLEEICVEKEGMSQTTEEEGQDIPPDFTRETEDHQEVIPEPNLNTKSEENNASEDVLSIDDVNQSADNHKEDTQQINEDEPMEVDGGEVSHSIDSNNVLNDESQDDTNQFEEENILGSENQPGSSEISLEDQGENAQQASEDAHEPVEDKRELSEELSTQHCQLDSSSSILEDNRDQITEGDQESPAELEQMQDESLKNVENLSSAKSDGTFDNEQQQSLQSFPLESMNQDSLSNVINDTELNINNQEPHAGEAENQEPIIQQHHEPESLENDQNIGNDQNDNVHPNFEDFTDESQQSASQKVSRDLNKEILDDWDDTDSQQSHGQEQDSREDEMGQAALNAAENVNKLMDDWDEEDEEQSKE